MNNTVENNPLSDDTILEGITKLQATLKKHQGPGFWNYSPYMHGLANGMIYSLSCIKGVDPVFLLQPEVWLKHDYARHRHEAQQKGLEEHWTSDMPNRRDSNQGDRRKNLEIDRRLNADSASDRRINQADRRVDELV